MDNHPTDWQDIFQKQPSLIPRTYDKVAVKLILGYFSAHISLHNSLSRIDISNNINKTWKELRLLSNDINDLLVRFCQFHKVILKF